MNQKNLLTIINISALAAITTLAIELYLPAFHLIATDFQTSSSWLQFSISVFLFGAGGSGLVFGVLSDLYGRQKILCLNLAIALVGVVVTLTAVNMPLFLLGRLLQGIAAGGIIISAKAIARDQFSGRDLNKVISVVLVSISIVSIIAPIIGSHIVTVTSWRMVFAVLLLYTLILFVLNQFFIPKSKPTFEIADFSLKQVVKHYLDIFLNKEFIRLLSILILIFSLQFIYSSIIPVMLTQQFQLTPKRIGTILAILTSFEISGMIMSVVLNRFAHPVTLSYIGVIIGLTASLILLISNLIFVLAVPVAVGFIGISLIGSGMAFPNVIGELLKIRVANVGMLVAISSVAERLFSSLVTAIISLLHLRSITGLTSAFALTCLCALILLSLPKIQPSRLQHKI